MEYYPLKIIGVEFDKNCPKKLIEPAKMYFELNDSFEFKYTIAFIRKKFDLIHKEISSIRKYSSLKYEMYCYRCKAYKPQYASNKNEFNLAYRNRSYVCQDCKELERKLKLQEIEKQQRKLREQQEKKKKEKFQKLNKAIDDKAWRKLTPYQFEVLKNRLSFKSYKEFTIYYWDKNPIRSEYKKLFSALRILASENLVIIETKYESSKGYKRIINCEYLERLKAEFEYNFELNDTSKVKNNPKQDSKNKDYVNHLKMRLTINDYNHHPDSPLHAGTIRFKEKIVIDPNIDYTFAQWERHNDDLYFTLVPTSEIEKIPVQKKLSQQPKAIQEHITNFLNNINPENN